MRRSTLSFLSLLLATIMLLGVLSSCTGDTPEATEESENESTEKLPNDESSDESTPPKETESSDKAPAETESSGDGSGDDTDETTEESTDAPEVGPALPNKHSELINNANSLANGVQAYFTDATRSNYCLENLEMVMNYGRSPADAQLVTSLSSKQGGTYVERTMDVFVRMTDGNTYYASESAKGAEVNLYRFGYYYYEGLFEFQNFIPKKIPVTAESEIELKKQNSGSYDVDRTYDSDSGVLSFVIKNTTDPRIFFDRSIKYSLEEYDTLVFTAKALGNTANLVIYAGENGYAEKRTQNVSLINDGEFHTYYVPLSKFNGLTNNLTGIRFDPSGGIGGGIEISYMSVAKSTCGVIPENLSINRHFHVYSDKMHQTIQFAVTERTENIAEVGMLTEISADTVNKLIIVDAEGKTYGSLEAIDDWKSVVAVGFDIKDAGIFGFILPVDDAAGNLRVTLEGNRYVIEQTRTPVLADGTEGVIIPSIDTENRDKNGFYKHAAGVKNNGNDFHLGQRVYTDANHDFAEFLLETGFEREPLSANRVSINQSGSDGSSYVGYDALRGIYVIDIGGTTGFGGAYKNPNRQYKANFNIRSDVDREIYIMCNSTTSGNLECAALMDENMMMLPVPIEVIKNFSEPMGERNLYNISDPSFSEAIFTLSLKGGEKTEYTLIHLYQNWGNFPLKQLSQIPFHCPYYHLSTGVTETNCIVPWFTTDTQSKSNGTLPDFRSMSAPFWVGQPQHNSCGSHSWLNYTDGEGTYSVECYENIITSYGPTYAEVVWSNLSDDGKIKVTYTHMEMPQVDENRSYYTMEYEFLEDLTIDNFKDSFRFYHVTDNAGSYYYERLGYLNEQNEFAYAGNSDHLEEYTDYVLGDECPCFSLFDMNDYDFNDSVQGYANVALLIYSSEFIIGGAEKEYSFLIRNRNRGVALTLNESGTVEFKKGDRITINAILLPWGSQEYEDGIIDLETTPPNYEYDMPLSDGSLYLDKNVRDVRENTLLDPLKVESDTDEIIESPFLPKVKSSDGKSATFTLSGGENNCTVKIYGFKKLTSPKVEELVDGEWVDYILSSSANPDTKGYYHYYDGYGVSYEDGAYAYSFVVDMTGDAMRTFRISAVDDFTPWPQEQPPKENENLLLGYTDHEEIFSIVNDSPAMFGTPVLGSDESCENYVSVYVKLDNATYKESYAGFYSPKVKGDVSGQYLVIKYRVPTTNTEDLGPIQFWTSTENMGAGGSEYFYLYPTKDDEWHVAVFDLSTYESLNFKKSEKGYSANFLRIDVFNKEFKNADTHIDIAYVGFDEDLMKICELESDNFEFIQLYKNGSPIDVNTSNGEEYVKSYLDPSSGYTWSTLPYFCTFDYVCGIRTAGFLSYSGTDIEVPSYLNGTTDSMGRASVTGWCVIEGGVSKYVYSTDGGKTWKDAIGSKSGSSDEMITVARRTIGSGFVSGVEEESKANGSFQSRLYFDLSSEIGKTVDVIFAAVPKADEKTLVILLSIDKVTPGIQSVFAEGSEYLEISIPYGAQADSVNGVSYGKESSTKAGVLNFADEMTTGNDGTITVRGWCALNGGVSKYVWTADGGKTWQDCGGSYGRANDEIVRVGAQRAGTEFGDAEATKVNGAFQGTGITVDLSAYKDSEEPLKIYVCAVPADMSDRVVILYTFESVVFPTATE